jgi:hypothetical protein
MNYISNYIFIIEVLNILIYPISNSFNIINSTLLLFYSRLYNIILPK